MQPSPETNKRDEDGFGADSKVCAARKGTPESLWGRATVGGKVGHGKVCVCLSVCVWGDSSKPKQQSKFLLQTETGAVTTVRRRLSSLQIKF